MSANETGAKLGEVDEQGGGRWWKLLSWTVWPSFLMAGVMEALVFAVFDPLDMTWWSGDSVEWPRRAVYTVSFFIFWWVCAVSSALSLFLALSPLPKSSREFEG